MSLVRYSRFISLAAGAFLLSACASTAQQSDDTMVSAETDTMEALPGSQDDFMNAVGASGDHVYFAYDRYDLNSASQETLRRQAAWLQMHEGAQIMIAGNCDERGTREYNLGLGDRRANSTRDFLVSLGVDPARISSISYGKEKPECIQSNETCWGRNRNSVTSITNSPTS